MQVKYSQIQWNHSKITDDKPRYHVTALVISTQKFSQTNIKITQATVETNQNKTPSLLEKMYQIRVFPNHIIF